MDMHLALVVDEDAEVRQRAAQELAVLGFESVARAPNDPGLVEHVQRQPGLVLQGISEGQCHNPLALHEHLAEHANTAKLLLLGSSHRDPRLIRSIADHARSQHLVVVGQLNRPPNLPQLASVCRPLLLAQPVTAKPTAVPVAPSMPTRRNLMDAIQSDLIRPWFQPIFCAKTQRIIRWEVLARWQREDGSYCPATQFIRMAERTGLIDKLFQRVMIRALHDARVWQDLGKPSRLSLNLSMANLDNPRLVDDLISAVIDTGLDPQSVTLEVTENAVAGCLERMLANISRLRLAGFPVSIDDFGTGISGLSQLSAIPFTELKLDRQFVRGIPNDQVNQLICRNVISMAHDLGMQVVAEGIETQDEANWMIDLGADELQGFLYARPMSGGDVLRFLG